jgi:hypothetical protein
LGVVASRCFATGFLGLVVALVPGLVVAFGFLMDSFTSGVDLSSLLYVPSVLRARLAEVFFVAAFFAAGFFCVITLC